jgi:hypothetical protein
MQISAKIIDLTTFCRFDSPLHHAAVRCNSPLHMYCSRESNFYLNYFMNLKPNQILGYDSGAKVGTFDEKKTEIELLCPKAREEAHSLICLKPLRRIRMHA